MGRIALRAVYRAVCHVRSQEIAACSTTDWRNPLIDLVAEYAGKSLEKWTITAFSVGKAASDDLQHGTAGTSGVSENVSESPQMLSK